MKIPFVDLKTQYDSIQNEISEAIQSVLNSTDFILGKDLTLFEREFADYVGVQFAVGVANGTEALQLSLLAMGVGNGDEVITAPNSFAASALSISLCGATPVFADIDPDTFTLDPETVRRAITKRTRVIMPVHLYGQTAELQSLQKIADEYGLKLLEDACQAHGAEYHGKKAGSIGDAAAFSFYPSKNLGAYGDGGLVTTKDPQIADRLMSLRNYGQKVKYHHDHIAFNSRLDTLQAAVLRVKLRHLDRWNLSRAKAAGFYDHHLEGTGLKLPTKRDSLGHIYHLYVVRTPNRDALLDHLLKNGVGASVHYPVPIHLQQAFQNLGYRQGDFPESEAACREVISLPMYAEITQSQQQYICDTIKKFSA